MLSRFSIDAPNDDENYVASKAMASVAFFTSSVTKYFRSGLLIKPEVIVNHCHRDLSFQPQPHF
jgi:hypothetical protein